MVKSLWHGHRRQEIGFTVFEPKRKLIILENSINM